VRFVTSGTVDGAAFAGQSQNADAFCQFYADNGEVSPGPYKALLSFDGISAKDRITDGPYVKFNGTPVARNKAELFGTQSPTFHAGIQPSANLLSAIDLDENNQPVEAQPVFTGTGSDGTTIDPRCNNWTSNSPDVFGMGGLTGATDSKWTSFVPFECDQPAHVYCFQQSHSST